jgi:hypothetical protein
MFWYSVLRPYHALFHVHIIIQVFNDCKHTRNFPSFWIFTLILCLTLQPPSIQYHIQYLWKNWHQMYLNAIFCVSRCDYFDCLPSHVEKSLNISLMTVRFFDVTEFTTQTPLSLFHVYSHSQLIAWKSVIPLHFCWNLLKKFSCHALRIDQIQALVPYKSCCLYHAFILSCVCTFVTITSHQWPLSIKCDILLLLNSTLLTADMIPLCMGKLVLGWWLAL